MRCCHVQRMGAVTVLNLGTMGTIFGKFLTLFAASLVLGAMGPRFKHKFETLTSKCPCRAQRMGAVPVLNLGTMGTIFGKFLTLFAASLVLGAVAGLFAAIMLKRFNVSSMPQARALRPLCTVAC